MIIGLTLRVWAAQVLGRFYTRTLRTTDKQRIVQSGPYHLIRHPGYLGTILIWIGAGLAVLKRLVEGANLQGVDGRSQMWSGFSRRLHPSAHSSVQVLTFRVWLTFDTAGEPV